MTIGRIRAGADEIFRFCDHPHPRRPAAELSVNNGTLTLVRQGASVIDKYR
jgi:hypothetical protein